MTQHDVAYPTAEGLEVTESAQSRGGVLADLAELIGQAEETQDYCSDAGPNEAMRRAASLTEIYATVAELIEALGTAVTALRSYQYGNSATKLAEEVADAGKAALARATGGRS